MCDVLWEQQGKWAEPRLTPGELDGAARLRAVGGVALALRLYHVVKVP